MSETVTKKRSLFSIGDDLIALENLINERDGDISDPEVEAAITAWFKELEKDLAGKTDGYVNLIRKWESELAAAKAEAEQYLKSAEVRSNRVKRLKEMLRGWMKTMNRSKIETETGRVVAIQNNGGNEPMELDEKVVSEVLSECEGGVTRYPNTKNGNEVFRFLRVRVELNHEAIREHLKSGKTLSFAKLLPRGQHVRIR